MALIRIQECSEQAGIYRVKVSFDQGQEYETTVHNPFSKEEEERLEWYFEEHLKFPFINQMKAQEAAASVTTYGERLFAQVFSAHTQILTGYRTATQEGFSTLQIEIVGRSHFHAFHWEAMKDPELSLPLALQATITRKNLSYPTIYANMHQSRTINLLVVTARPRGEQDVGYRTISRPLIEALSQDTLPVKIDILRPGTYKSLETHLHAMTEQYGVGYYHIIHFDVHGSLMLYDSIPSWIRNQRYGRDKLQPYEGMKAFLFLEREDDDNADLLEGAELAKLLIENQIPIVILNACQSSKQVGDRETSLASHLMQSGVQTVLAMGYSVTVTAAALLMKTLYQQLFEGCELSTAIRAARSELYKHKGRRAHYNQEIQLEDWLLPVVYQNQPRSLVVQAFSSERNATYMQSQTKPLSVTFPEPHYGFVGRDLDILHIEKRLLTRRNILLIRGMGGLAKPRSYTIWDNGGKRPGWLAKSSTLATMNEPGACNRSSPALPNISTRRTNISENCTARTQKKASKTLPATARRTPSTYLRQP